MSTKKINDYIHAPWFFFASQIKWQKKKLLWRLWTTKQSRKVLHTPCFFVIFATSNPKRAGAHTTRQNNVKIQHACKHVCAMDPVYIWKWSCWKSFEELQNIVDYLGLCIARYNKQHPDVVLSSMYRWMQRRPFQLHGKQLLNYTNDKWKLTSWRKLQDGENGRRVKAGAIMNSVASFHLLCL